MNEDAHIDKYIKEIKSILLPIENIIIIDGSDISYGVKPKMVLFPIEKMIIVVGSNLSCGVLPNSSFQEVVTCGKINKETKDDELEEFQHFSFK